MFNANLSFLSFPTFLFLDIPGMEMKKINVIDFYRMAEPLGYLKLLTAGQHLIQIHNIFSRSQHWLDVICTNPSNIVQLERTKPSAKALNDILSMVFERILKDDRSDGLRSREIEEIQGALHRFEIIFAEECSDLATFYVGKIRLFSVNMLIDRADNAFEDSIRKRLSAQCLEDIRAAGKCIAFELGTAAGFHSYRALEATALHYVTRLGKTFTDKDKRDLFVYLEFIEKNGGDKDVVQVSQQIRSKKRNPLMHPTDNLSPDEGIDAFQISTSAISELVRDMEQQKLFPN